MIRSLSIGMVALGWMGSGLRHAEAAVATAASARWVADTSPSSRSLGRFVITPDAEKKVKMEFVKIKAGKFMMGSENEDAEEKPVREVTITKDYWMQTTETTQGQWEAVMGKNPSFFKGADLPVETVSWEECQEFLKKLNEKAKDQLKGKAAKLPTEAEWEYACRAGEKGKWCFGDDEKKLSEYAWSEKNSDDKTHPVGQKKPNAWGLYDMHGNVREWCEDWYEKYPSEAVTDPTGPAEGEYRCLRGGSWDYSDYITRSADRLTYGPSGHIRYVGFRAAVR